MEKENTIKDYFGQELQVDDLVVYYANKCFQMGKIVKLNPKTVSIVGFDRANHNWRTSKSMPNHKYGHECVKVDQQMGMLHLLKGNYNA